MTRHRLSLLAVLLCPLLMGAAADDPLAPPAGSDRAPRGIALPGLNLPGPTRQQVEQLQRAGIGGDAAALFTLGELAGKAGNASAAFDAMRRAADQHCHPAEGALAEMLYRGFGTDPDAPRAAIMARRSADGGDAGGQQVLGWLFAIGAGVEQSWPDAVRWTSQAAAQGNARAQADLGWILLNRNDAPPEVDQAIAWYERAAGQDDAMAETQLGMIYMYASGYRQPANIERAALLFRHAAQQGDTLGERELGLAYWTGSGIEHSDVDAVAWFTTASQQGDERASLMLSNAYEAGRGVVQDRIQSWTWLLRAAEQGDALARIVVARAYAGSTWGPRTDLTEAAKWFEAALEVSDPMPRYRPAETSGAFPTMLALARFEFGSMVEFGQGTKKQLARAWRLFEAAADAGNERAMNRIGFMYHNGVGVPEIGRAHV